MMQTEARVSKEVGHDHGHQEVASRTLFGFWLYILTDCILFGTLFATYQVLHHNTFFGPGPKELFSLPFVLVETLLLLTSSLTCALAGLYAKNDQKKVFFFWLALTFLLGLSFLGMELYEFSNLVAEGNSWTRSGFLSAFFTLVGTHGAHISAGLVWILIMMGQVAFYGMSHEVLRRLKALGLFWHFLDLVWIFIYSSVYLMGGV